ncbi:MAG: twin-arginine translocase subunit TatC [Elusimicrobia bacterium]|nr:twin-arginine translocase subunit TatC [Elusimicrobiota bacterium]
MSALVPRALPGLDEDRPLPFWSHVGELRVRLVAAALALLAGTAACYVLRLRLWALAKRPLLAALASRRADAAELAPFAYTGLAEPFFSFMRLSFWAAVLLVSPYLFYQVWAFVRPALRPRDRVLATRFVAATSVCFAAGAAFAYVLAFPLLCDLLLDEAFAAGLRPSLRPAEYLDLLLYTVAGVGACFEAPVLFYFLARFELIGSRAMLRRWREAAVAILLAAAFLTPGDVIATSALFGVVLLGLYALSIGVVRLVELKNRT